MTRPYENLTIEQVARLPRPGTVLPGNIGFTPDSRAVTYLFSAEGNLERSLWRFDIATGERRVIAGPPPPQAFSREEELRRERQRLREVGVTSYAFAKARPTLLVPLEGAVHVSTDGAGLREVSGTAGAIDPRLDPAGERIAFVRDGDLHVVDVATGEGKRLTHDAEDGLTNGLADFIAQEELDQDHGFWWSPDGSLIAFIRADSRHIPVFPIVHQGKDTVDIEPHRYPFAGEANARLKLGVVQVATGRIAWMGLAEDADFYIPRIDWRPDGALTAQVLLREQRDLALVAFEGRQPRVLIQEHSEPWLNLHHSCRFLESGEILWADERTGFMHLSLHDAAGQRLRTLTAGEWVVTGLIGVDEPRRLVYFTANREGPAEQHVYRVSLDGGEIERLSEGAGFHSAVLSPDGGYLVVTQSQRAQAPVVRVLRSDGAIVHTLFEDNEVTAESLGLVPPEIVQLPAADGTTTLFGAVYSPPKREPGRRYPVVVSVYGGPHVQRVFDGWSATVDLRAQYLAQQGFVVLKVDNRGSFARGLAFESAIHLDTGHVEVLDQVAAVRWLGENYHYADVSRTGIYGWSYGGYMTLMCMARAPETFHVGVAGAPVTHWDGYDTGYTERYMSTPEKNAAGYEQSSVMAHLDGLRGKLLVVHGMIDENVHFRHTARLLVALAAAGKEYDLLVYPEERHMPRDQKGMEAEERRVLGFLMQNLRPD